MGPSLSRGVWSHRRDPRRERARKVERAQPGALLRADGQPRPITSRGALRLRAQGAPADATALPHPPCSTRIHPDLRPALRDHACHQVRVRQISLRAFRQGALLPLHRYEHLSPGGSVPGRARAPPRHRPARRRHPGDSEQPGSGGEARTACARPGSAGGQAAAPDNPPHPNPRAPSQRLASRGTACSTPRLRSNPRIHPPHL
mmetsp:Transcript_33468/g.76514  ORF Transcript_33468/g.76514 Transcript_33468/m.76514 type:complete len:203 (+) Transcript_33468:348-956(+)